MRRAAKKRTEAVQKVLSELPLSTRNFSSFTKLDPASNQRKVSGVHETHNQYNKLPKLSPMDLSRMKAEKDARDGQDLVIARQRQSEQARQDILMREQAQRVATIPVRNLLLFRSVNAYGFADCPSATTATKHISISTGTADTATAYTEPA